MLVNETSKSLNLAYMNKINIPYIIRVKMMRCVKDKVHSGFYIVLCNVLDRVGGEPIKYSMGSVLKRLRKLKKI